MTDVTPRLLLPLLASGQAQKEMTHNEALVRVDLVAGCSVVSAGQSIPPADPTAGQCWIVGTAASAAWTGKDRAIAGWTSGGWRFVVPRTGMIAWVEDRGSFARYVDDAWIIGALLGAPLAAIPVPTGGMTIDVEARATLDQIVTRLQHFGLAAAD